MLSDIGDLAAQRPRRLRKSGSLKAVRPKIVLAVEASIAQLLCSKYNQVAQQRWLHLMLGVPLCQAVVQGMEPRRYGPLAVAQSMTQPNCKPGDTRCRQIQANTQPTSTGGA